MIQRKPPAKRLFKGGVGGVIPPVITEAPAVTTPPSISLVDFVIADEHAEAAKEETAVQKHRRLKREQLAAIKEKLATPWQERDAEARVEIKKTKASLYKGGLFMRGAPKSKGELVTGGYDSEKIALVAAARDRAAVLGPTSNGDENYWPDNDRRKVKPQGGSEEREVDVKTRQENKHSTFQVKLSGPKAFQYEQDLSYVTYFYFGVIVEDANPSGETPLCRVSCYQCRLCDTLVDWETETRRHIETAHGDEDLEGHDARFGNIIDRYVKAGRRFPKILDRVKLAKAVAAPPRKRLHRNVLKTKEVATSSYKGKDIDTLADVPANGQ